jgi:hypothetical protein
MYKNPTMEGDTEHLKYHTSDIFTLFPDLILVTVCYSLETGRTLGGSGSPPSEMVGGAP